MASNKSRNNKSKSNERLTVDAIHPLFNGYRDQKLPKPSVQDIAYFCRECQSHFSQESHSVSEHFQNRAHRPIDSCVYCQGPVCEYYLKNDRFFYHNCNERNNSQSDQSFTNLMKNIYATKDNCDIS